MAKLVRYIFVFLQNIIACLRNNERTYGINMKINVNNSSKKSMGEMGMWNWGRPGKGRRLAVVLAPGSSPLLQAAGANDGQRDTPRPKRVPAAPSEGSVLHTPPIRAGQTTRPRHGLSPGHTFPPWSQKNQLPTLRKQASRGPNKGLAWTSRLTSINFSW